MALLHKLPTGVAQRYCPSQLRTSREFKPTYPRRDVNKGLRIVGIVDALNDTPDMIILTVPASGEKVSSRWHKNPGELGQLG